MKIKNRLARLALSIASFIPGQEKKYFLRSGMENDLERAKKDQASCRDRLHSVPEISDIVLAYIVPKDDIMSIMGPIRSLLKRDYRIDDTLSKLSDWNKSTLSTGHSSLGYVRNKNKPLRRGLLSSVSLSLPIFVDFIEIRCHRPLSSLYIITIRARVSYLSEFLRKIYSGRFFPSLIVYPLAFLRGGIPLWSKGGTEQPRREALLRAMGEFPAKIHQAVGRRIGLLSPQLVTFIGSGSEDQKRKRHDFIELIGGSFFSWTKRGNSTVLILDKGEADFFKYSGWFIIKHHERVGFDDNVQHQGLIDEVLMNTSILEFTRRYFKEIESIRCRLGSAGDNPKNLSYLTVGKMALRLAQLEYYIKEMNHEMHGIKFYESKYTQIAQHINVIDAERNLGDHIDGMIKFLSEEAVNRCELMKKMTEAVAIYSANTHDYLSRRAKFLLTVLAIILAVFAAIEYMQSHGLIEWWKEKL